MDDSEIENGLSGPIGPDANDITLARFPSNLNLPPAEQSHLADAANAVRREFRDCSTWKRLHCRRVSIVAERDRGLVCVLDVGASVEFDWTWEGATAFCPRSLDDNFRFSDFSYERADYEDDILWSGEVLEVDEAGGALFISLDNPERVPSVGSFFVRPFEFLQVLDAVYNDAAFETTREQLPCRLHAARGSVHPQTAEATQPSLPQLKRWWQHTWSILWGPPGTGKTYTTGRQVAAALDDTSERILVVSTTNRATDAAALAIGRAASEMCPHELADDTLLRIGKGASYQSFVDEGLESMLRGTESETLARIDELAEQLQLLESPDDKALARKQIKELRTASQDDSRRVFVDSEKRVVAATVFKAMSFLRNETIRKMIDNGESPFTTIFIDEAGLISRAVVAALSLLAARRVVLVGDSKQLAPISRIVRVLPLRQQIWLGSSGVSHLDDFEATQTGVHVLSEQRRMHPDVCRVVSDYQYDGRLITADDRIQQPSSLTPFIANHSRVVWYVLDEDATDLASIRASRGPSNRSWIRSITPLILQKLFSCTDVKSTRGLFISPYKAQAQAVSKLLAEWKLNHWEASTVHSQQGSEADIVVFDTVKAGSGGWQEDEWKRLVNVALSRAREAIIVLASRSEMEEPYLRPLLSTLTPSTLVEDGAQCVWKACSSIDPDNTSTKTHHLSSNNSMGDQFAARKAMKPILSQEQQRLVNLDLDGKPRLVRGVAGSGKSLVLCNWLAKTAQRMSNHKDARIWAVYANQSLHKLLRDSIESAWDQLHAGTLFKRPEFPWQQVALLHVKDVLAGLLPGGAAAINRFEFAYDRAAEEFLNQQGTDNLLPRCDALFIDEAQDMGPSTLWLLLSIVEQSDEADPNSRAAHIFYDNAQNIYGTKVPKWSDFGLDMRGRSRVMRHGFRSTKPIVELAVNVLNRLTDAKQNYDQQELISLGLLERTTRGDEEWLRVRFTEEDGPKPIYCPETTRDAELDKIARHLQSLIQHDGISPTDICMLYNGKAEQVLQDRLAPKLADFGIELSRQRSQAFERRSNTIVATTPHSYKGYESEVIVIPCVDHYLASQGKILANGLYVAMTRAKSLLAIYGVTGGSIAAQKLHRVLSACVKLQNSPPDFGLSDEYCDEGMEV